MNRGYYNAASAMLTIQKHMQSTSNNIANIGTTGYKREQSIEGVFDSMMIHYGGDILGSLPTKVGQRDNVVIYEQGAFQTTSRQFDLALNGEGFFKVLDDKGNVRYTRNGEFNKDGKGFLVDSNGFYLLTDSGKIQVPNSNLSVNAKGEIFSNDASLGKLDIVNLQNPIKTGLSYYKGTQEIPSKASVAQGFLEACNTDMSKEMIALMAHQKSYQFNQKMLMAQDEISKKVINDLFK